MCPVKETLSESKSKEAKETVDVKVVSALVAVSSFNCEHLFCLRWVLGVFHLPHSHQVVNLRADCEYGA